LGVTVSASLYARRPDHFVLPEHRTLNGAMCEELKDSSATKDMKKEYNAALKALKKAQADLTDKQAAMQAQQKLLSEAQTRQQEITTECATAVREQQQAEAEAQRQAALEATREQQARAQAEWAANMEAQRKAAAEAQQKTQEEAQKRQAEWQAVMAAQQQAAQQALSPSPSTPPSLWLAGKSRHQIGISCLTNQDFLITATRIYGKKCSTLVSDAETQERIAS
jgi:myosin heavy subunit